ncbi:MAG: tRNA adenosine(34) deaminase TadA [[Clostridium] aminophilum]|uniref:tRNA adenosine(34) deaminase TadA n=2 Tax=[Clostridium] aminophilum TaxID=1526 RepID=UPI0026EB994E|nr:tRNA adenosine(34) deaminase TadA [[Clostridium] aminophilum]MDD6195894.1 tRNA adenosine(34) deaminase TadA [[Clostridium] aminophilum]
MADDGKMTKIQTAGKAVSRLTDEEYFMREAIRQARRAKRIGDVPIGCVIVHDGTIIGRGYNRRVADGNVLAHAEIIAMRKACREMGDWRLEECTMYVTLEPCPMCAGAIVQARIPKVVIGAMNPKAGCAGSVMNLLDEPGFNHQCEVEIGVRGEECSMLLKEFFRDLRTKSKKAAEEKASLSRNGDN